MPAVTQLWKIQSLRDHLSIFIVDARKVMTTDDEHYNHRRAGTARASAGDNVCIAFKVGAPR